MNKYIVIRTGGNNYVFDMAKVKVHQINNMYQEAKKSGIRWNVDYLSKN